MSTDQCKFFQHFYSLCKQTTIDGTNSGVVVEFGEHNIPIGMVGCFKPQLSHVNGL